MENRFYALNLEVMQLRNTLSLSLKQRMKGGMVPYQESALAPPPVQTFQYVFIMSSVARYFYLSSDKRRPGGEGDKGRFGEREKLSREREKQTQNNKEARAKKKGRSKTRRKKEDTCRKKKKKIRGEVRKERGRKGKERGDLWTIEDQIKTCSEKERGRKKGERRAVYYTNERKRETACDRLTDSWNQKFRQMVLSNGNARRGKFSTETSEARTLGEHALEISKHKLMP
ncbi:Hypothetical predicted protein [Scomber scombrus]|uniref:Uncharacterized protein n=1 Tax=Scomber scombrus TaxID=13677 RepID=A0AAV1PL74_SCOSC